MSISDPSAAQTPLLDDTVDGCLDYKGRPVRRSSSGCWRSASFIIVVEIAERFAYYGISSNLITYLTGPLGESTATAAAQVNAWNGAASLLPLLGAFIADSFLGRYRTIILASLDYVLPKVILPPCEIFFPWLLGNQGWTYYNEKNVKPGNAFEIGFLLLGIGLLALSATLSSISSSGGQNADDIALSSSLQFQVILFFFSLYLVAFAQGGHKPCVQAFGADQFDTQDAEECKAKSSFFNWWYFGMCAGTLTTLSILNYIQDNLSWVLGFAIPGIVMAVGLVVFLLGTMTYRNRKTSYSAIAAEEEARGILATESSKQFFLNKALLAPDGSKEQGEVCSIREVEEAKAVIRLAPIWATSLTYAIVFAQSSTFFTKQGATMDRSTATGFEIPAASLQSFISLSIVLFIPIYDRIFVPLTRALTGEPAGITLLQRIGSGMRCGGLKLPLTRALTGKPARNYICFREIWKLGMRCGGLNCGEEQWIDRQSQLWLVPMSIWWLVPQYALYGLADVFTMVGLQEFFYDQMPNELRSVGLALYLSIFGVGSFLSSFLISAIENLTSRDGRDSWFANNLNRAHLDYFYLLLAALSAVGLTLYVCCTKYYIYSRWGRTF
ncbi:hypothetical protein GOBAR_AA02544 [Gossypium barbadense]|uniref:Major facilitator superfamily (MFS) profile domain-containing protein n=1 Tax=Gossypium barbadense TaxID=3634 RepID=A0A2P5YR30_GOSBA|nr:hypothetical protein GOBAR_AA02544 [Gossypium barbadense]